MLREPNSSDTRFVNASFSARETWDVSHHIQVAVIGTYSSAGRFINVTGPAEDIALIEITAQYAF